ncbi:MAG: DegT/DnrJ/EryC1/StrS family aminotransferase [Actinomycetia bacterium]|nr:DegT/DnrJ/EryC1/StrS family aminotransferase [Actinomycetes bacterium]
MAVAARAVRGGDPLTPEPIPLARPLIDEREEQLVLEVLRSGRLALGPMIERFEGALGDRLGARYVAAVSSGTAGLHLAVRLAGITAGDEVITSPFSFVASANCLLYEGALPVFADVDERSFNLDPAAVEDAITPRTRAILPVDIFGYPAELAELRELAERNGLAFIEDACEAVGAEYRGRPLGSLGHPTVLAFYPNKQMTTAEGGAVAVGTEEEWRLVKSLANQGRSDDGGWLQHVHLGFNYRMDELSAALGVAQLEKLDRLLALRAQAAEYYTAALKTSVDVELPWPDNPEHRRSWFVYVVKLAEGVDREAVITAMSAEGIATSRYLPAVHLQPYMRERFGHAEGLAPVCENISRRTLALPFFPSIAREQQNRVVGALKRAIDRAQ